ncbi:cysteine desulfurase [hydrocarbon metagenome]|uniref:cysteine desulfurase n=1 Tax=hydrocarbon metagenome TaxID=938273 RepID=A0A0W8E4Y6_9ZZZZ
MRAIYMDNAATTFPKPEQVYQAVDYFNRHMGGNPGRGSNKATLQAGSLLMDCRDALADLFNIADSSHIAFTSNITEALNIAVKGILKPGDHVISSSMEHNAIARPLHVMSQQNGVEWTLVPCAGDGTLDPKDVRKAVRPNTRMICTLHASNLTGTLMPVEEVGAVAREYDLLFVLDTAQTAGVVPIDVESLSIDVLTFTGHKGLLGPQGTGGIYLRPGLDINPLKHGGTGSLSEYLEHPSIMPDMLESGTHNTPGIAGLLAGLGFIKENGGIDKIRSHEQYLCDRLIKGLKEISGMKIYGPIDSSKRTAVVSFNINDIDCGEVSTQLDYKYGIVTRSGLHCAPLAHRTIGTFESGSCRLSPGYFSSIEEIDMVIKAVHEVAASK